MGAVTNAKFGIAPVEIMAHLRQIEQIPMVANHESDLVPYHPTTCLNATLIPADWHTISILGIG